MVIRTFMKTLPAFSASFCINYRFYGVDISVEYYCMLPVTLYAVFDLHGNANAVKRPGRLFGLLLIFLLVFWLFSNK